MLEPEDLNRLLRTLLDAYDRKIEDMNKIALEVRPDSMSRKKIVDLKSIGFNRISLGVQTFNKDVLARLQRHVDVERTLRCYDWIRQAGFDDVSFDMMFRLAYFEGRFGFNLEKYLKSFRDPARVREEIRDSGFLGRDAFLRLTDGLKKLKRFQAWLEMGILEKEGNHLRVKEEFKISGETWDDLYMS